MFEERQAFLDRREAGRQLGEELAKADWRDPVVLALPRGGVPVGFEVARALHAPLPCSRFAPAGARESRGGRATTWHCSGKRAAAR